MIGVMRLAEPVERRHTVQPLPAPVLFVSLRARLTLAIGAERR